VLAGCESSASVEAREPDPDRDTEARRIRGQRHLALPGRAACPRGCRRCASLSTSTHARRARANAGQLPASAPAPGAILIMESEHHISLSEELWDLVGFAGMFVDYTAMELPTPSERDSGGPTRVRIKFNGKLEWLDYAFDPTQDVVGWMGDPIVFKMNVWDIPGIGTTHSFLTPPPTRSSSPTTTPVSSTFSVLAQCRPCRRPTEVAALPLTSTTTTRSGPNTSRTSRSRRRVTSGTCRGRSPIPGLRAPAEYPSNPVREIRELQINFDTKTRSTEPRRLARHGSRIRRCRCTPASTAPTSESFPTR
jgi:hypothetical protein